MLKSVIKYLAIILFIVVSIVACNKKKQENIPNSRLADENIRSSFSITPSQVNSESSAQNLKLPLLNSSDNQFISVNNTSLIVLKKSALGKAFFLSLVLLPAENAPIFQHLLPKVVSFEMNGEDLALFELNTYALYNELPSTKLLQTFKIKQNNEDSITFSWDQGLSTIPSKGSIWISDLPSSLEQLISEEEIVLPTVATFLKSAIFVEDRLELEQISRVRTPSHSATNGISDSYTGNTDNHITVQLRATLTPYRPNSNFTSRNSALKDGIGFFEIAQTRKNEGGMDILASRWDISQEAGFLTYSITKNAPAELIQAITEGVLYWNKYFGREVIKVETGADPLKKPRPRELLIYWIPWKYANFASASIQPDPITGEIKGGSIFLPDTFAFQSPVLVRKNLQRQTTKAQNYFNIFPSGFKFSSLCDHPVSLDFSTNLSYAIKDDPEIILKARKDYIRNIVAHEVGHTLGLRHNFAGSVASELNSVTDHHVKWKEYLGDINHPGAVVSSTVMDYLMYKDNFLSGAAILKRTLAYDQAAIAWGYLNNTTTKNTQSTPLFCTDIKRMYTNTLGCKDDDSGKNPFAGWVQEMSLHRLELAQEIIDSIILSIRPDNQKDKLSVKEAVISLNPNSISNFLTKPAQEIFKLLSNEGRSLDVDKDLGELNWLNEDLYKTKTQQLMSTALDEVNGIPGILMSSYGLDYSWNIQKGWLVKNIHDKLNTESIRKGRTINGLNYDLSDEEINDLKKYVPMLAVKLEETYLRDLLLSLTGVKPPFENYKKKFKQPDSNPSFLFTPKKDDVFYADNIVKEEWKSALEKISEQIITDVNGNLNGSIEGKEITVPKPKFIIDTRLAAARLFSNKIFNKEDWLSDTQSKVLATIENRVLQVIGKETEQLKITSPTQSNQQSIIIALLNQKFSSIPSIKGKKLSPELKEWMLDELAVLTALKELDLDNMGY
ncbi:zinc-dependent metalloprotease [Pigmentibacter ruber]|uniref:zinc-dependent metalloprotease n=1 Tax=Pigmentibacter ruber TaxID=2683196 RepID=UPI00131BDE48|nr:zinc-dependent metalloprotease [Pigmentibacter ruber]